jgi:hypothetical protein
VLTKPALNIAPLRVGCEGVVMFGTACERYNHAHPGASFSEFLLACQHGDVE